MSFNYVNKVYNEMYKIYKNLYLFRKLKLMDQEVTLQLTQN